MILVDTSVLIGYLRGDTTPAVKKFSAILEGGLAYGISAFTYQEILHGAATEKEFKTLKEYLDTQTIFYLTKEKESHADAALLFFRCRKSGYTVRSVIDCLIAQTAIEHDLGLLHQNKDFEALAKSDTRLFQA